MKILMVVSDWGVPLGGDGGSSVHVRSLAKALAELGCEVRLLVSNPEGPRQPGLPVRSVPRRTWWPGVKNRVERLRGLSVPARSVPVPSPDEGGQRGGACGEAAATPPRPLSPGGRLYYEALPRLLDQAEELLWHPLRVERAVGAALDSWRPDAIYERYALGQTGCARAARRRDVPHLVEVNAPLSRERSLAAGPWRTLARLTERNLLRRADALFCVSAPLRDLALGLGRDPNDVVVTPNGFDADLFRPGRARGVLRERLCAAPGDIVAGFVGALSPGRGARRFVRIMGLAGRRQANLRAVVVGDGPLMDQCRTLAAESGLGSRLSFLGRIPHDEVPDLLAGMDLAVAPYRPGPDFYFSPMKIIEYMACGLAVVAPRVDAVESLVEHGRSGLLVAEPEEEAWAEAVLALCADPALRAEMGRQGARKAQDNPTWQDNARQVMERAARLARGPVIRGRRS